MDLYITAFFTLFVIIDPIGLSPIFVALTPGQSARARFRIALRACLIGAAVLTIFGLVGEKLLEFIGISMPAFRISGGILLFAIALDMLFEKRTQRREDRTEEAFDDPSVFPLATPLIAGPGAMATMILLLGAPELTIPAIFGLHLVMLSVITLVFAFFMLAGPLERIVGDTGIKVITRLMGMLLAALAVQFVLDGLANLGILPT